MITLTLNGRACTVKSLPMTRLLDVLRIEIGLTGTKEGCGEGECGTCTVLLDGLPVNACLVPVGQCEGRTVVTIEGLAEDPQAVALARKLVEHNGAQCGMCTPGVVASAHALLQSDPSPTEDRTREALAGNLCRCTGYQRIVDAVLAAAEERS